MDILDPLDTSDVHDDGEKVSLGIEEHSLGSDIDDPHVEHLSPQTLLETPQEDVQYSFRTPEGTVTYGVLKVEDDNVPQLITSPNFSNSSVPQLVTSNINGHLYVIGNASDVFVSQSGGPRPIAPRASLVEGTSVQGTQNIKKVKRDERRRATHNEVERRRRDKINNWITKLSKIIPETTCTGGEIKNNGHYDGQSKGGILAKACEYITELRDSHRKLEESEAEKKRLVDTLDAVKRKNLQLDSENKALRELLKHNGITVIDDST